MNLVRTIQSCLATLTLSLVPLTGIAQDGDKDVFNLDPFVVNTDNVGYQARNSLSATKFEMQVKEVPIMVSSLTQEYIEDTYSQSLADAVRFTSGVTDGNTSAKNAEENDAFYIRGLRTGRSKRNGIVQLFTQDMTNVQKVEVVKGPMSLLYGQVEPGGIINYLTLNALPERRTDLKLTGGNFDHFRAQLNHTGPILDGDADTSGRLLYRFDASYKVDGGYRYNTEDERSFWSGLLEYKPYANTTIEFQWDYLNQNSFNVAPLPRINKRWREIWLETVASTPSDQLSDLVYLGTRDPYRSYRVLYPPNTPDSPSFLSGFIQAAQKTEDPKIFENGVWVDNPLFADAQDTPRIWDAYAEHWDWKLNLAPINAFNNVDTHISSLEVRQRLFDDWFAKLMIVHNDINRESMWGQPNGLLINSETSTGYFSNHWDRYNDDTAYQLELTGKWEIGPVENQTIMGLEYLDENYEAFLATDSVNTVVNPSVFDEIVANPDNNPYVRSGVLFTDTSDIFFDREQWPLQPNSDQEKETKAAFISNVARFFNGRFLVLGGLRYDEIRIEEYQRDSDDQRVLASEPFEESSVSPQIGTSLTLTDNLTVYASYSESFVPQSGDVTELLSVLPPATDENGNQIPYDSEDVTRKVAKRPLSGTGYEFGAKFDFLEEKLSGSFSVFHTELEGTTKSFAVALDGYLDEDTNRQLAPLVDSQNNGREVDGFESELFIRPFEGLQVVLTYAYIDSKEILTSEVSDIREGKEITTEIPSVTVPRHQVGLWSKYTFPEGRFDGLSIGGGFSWLDQRFGEYTLLSDNEGAQTGIFLIGENESVDRKVLLDDQITYDLLISYDFPIGDVDYTFQLNFKNLLDDRFMLPGGMPNEPRRIFASLQARF